MKRKPYPSDLTDAEWAMLSAYIPAPKAGGRPAKHARREIVNGIAYVLRAGGSWRMLPHDLPPWKTVYDYFRQWRDAGLWERLPYVLSPEASAAAIGTWTGALALRGKALWDQHSAEATAITDASKKGPAGITPHPQPERARLRSAPGSSCSSRGRRRRRRRPMPPAAPAC